MTLRLHRAPRADLLVDALAQQLRTPQADPFARELVIVPARGVERWVSQRLSHVLGASQGDGVCAGVEFRVPRSIVAEVLGSDLDDVWSPDALVWPLLQVVDAVMGQPWAMALTQHLGHSGRHGDEHRQGRRYAVAHRLARLFASYASQRPSMLAAWESGADTDGTGVDVDPDLAWQPELWRRLVAHVGGPTPGERQAAAVARLQADPTSSDLPARLSLFGHTRLTVTEVDLVRALSHHRDVDVWLPHASDALWVALRDASQSGVVPRSDDESHRLARQPLLATLGRDVRELQRTLAPISTASVALDAETSGPTSTTLLGRLQADVVDNCPPAVGASPDPADRSIQVHACHGPARQVEVLREVVLGLLADDPSLEPRDVVVMCPDIETFAPLIEAAFGLGGVAGTAATGWHPGQALQVRLADRSLAQTNPVLAVVGRLLDLADGRAEVSEVLDLAATEPVRRRFGFSDDDLDTIGRWAADAGVRWAFDAGDRAVFGLGGVVQNTWRFGLDRMLAGVAVSADARRYFGRTLPYDAVGSSDIELVGRLCELIDRLRDVADQLTGTRPAAAWVDTLRTAIGSLTSVAWGEEWQLHQAERELAAIGADQADPSLTLRLPDVRSLMRSHLVGRPSRANFRTGSLTVCTLVPMRSVPHRVVCLLGLDDGVFPRAGALDGDDVLARRPLTGERDPRSEDRQLLLDAVLAAREHLVVTYSGADAVSGRPRPPAVPLGELLDAVAASLPPGQLGHVLVEHPLQSFDPRNFDSRDVEAAAATPFSFDVAARAAAAATRSPRTRAPGLDDLVLPPAPIDDVDLAALGAFLRSPVKEFLRRRLGVSVRDDDDALDTAMPIELDGLQQWAIGSAMLGDRLDGLDPDQSLQMAWRRGDLPPGRFGWELARTLADDATELADRALDVMAGVERSSIDVDVDLGDGRRLQGTVTGLHGDRLVAVSYSRFGPRHFLDAWVPLLALAAGRPDRPWTAGTVTRPKGGTQMVVFDALDPEIARGHLRDLVDLRDTGLARPLRLPLKTGHALAVSLRRTRWDPTHDGRPRPVDKRVRSAWEGRWWNGTFIEGENARDHHPQVWGPRSGFETLTDTDPGQGITALATRLWRPVLEAAVTP